VIILSLLITTFKALTELPFSVLPMVSGTLTVATTCVGVQAVNTKYNVVPTEMSLFLETISAMVLVLEFSVLVKETGTSNLTDFTLTGELLVILSTNMVLTVISLFPNSTLFK